MGLTMLEIEVCEVRGCCPVYKVGDKMVIDEPKGALHARGKQLSKFEKSRLKNTEG